MNPQIHVLDNGELFPFLSSTGLHPEWYVCFELANFCQFDYILPSLLVYRPTAALDHVDREVAKEVQNALLSLRDHATSLDLGCNLLCETTSEIAQLAHLAAESGLFAGFRTARSYFEVRTKQQDAGFLTKNDKQESHCIRDKTLYEDMVCPEGQYKLPKEEFDISCTKIGLECKHGYQCYCKPCIKAYEVAVFQSSEDRTANNFTVDENGCNKMSLCGMIEQRKTIHFMIVDNRKREKPLVEVDIYLDFETIHMDVKPHATCPYTYEMTWSHANTGIGVMNIHFDGEQIPQSPVRIQVIDRRCDLDFPGQRQISNAAGGCDCGEGYVFLITLDDCCLDERTHKI